MKKLALDSLLALAFLCLLTTFVEAVYTFGLLGTDIPPEIVCVLFLLSPLLLLVFPRLPDSRPFSLVAGCGALVLWGLSLPLGTRWRMLATGAGCGLFLLFFAARLRQAQRSALQSGAGVALGLLLMVALRALRSGSLLLADGLPLWLGEACALAGCILLVTAGREGPAQSDAEQDTTSPAAPRALRAAPRALRAAGNGRVLGLCLGMFAALVVLYSVFSSPTVLARWGEVSYPAVTLVIVGCAALFLGLWAGVPGIGARLSPTLLFAWNVLFLLALALTLLFRQPPLGANAAWPVYAAAQGSAGRLDFWAMIVLHPVLYADIAFLAAGLRAARPAPRALAGGFALGAFFLLLAVFAQIFTTVYDYIPVIGPVFRNGYWLVLSIPAAVVAAAILLVPPAGKPTARVVPGTEPVSTSPLLALPAFAAAAVAALLSLVPLAGGPASGPVGAVGALRIMSYNLQQGYGKTGEKSFEAQLEAIRRMNPDVVGLAETDTARIAGGNADLVRYLADRLAMHAYYGPTPISGTFGVALLSRYPIARARTFFMPSRGEQTAAIDAGIVVNGKPVELLVTHLDNDGAMPQQRLVVDRAVAALRDAVPSAVAVAMGDFNFDPSTAQYRLTTSLLEDAWQSAEQRVVEQGASDPAGRIDHIFLSPGTRVLDGRYLTEGPSDHPAIFAEIALP